jgi:DNA adenine methylase
MSEPSSGFGTRKTRDSSGREMIRIEARPFLKWPGGKRWAAGLIAQAVAPQLRQTYIEPFVGSGAVFFHLQPRKAVLADINPELICCLRCVKDDVRKVVRALSRWSNTEESYYRIRSQRHRRDHLAAARLIYLSHTCWGGLYRVNQRGEFNVPYANSGRPAFYGKDLVECSRVLKSARVLCSDFEMLLDRAAAGDVVYVDPPYTTLGQNNGFVRYNERLFAWRDQQRLARACARAVGRGAQVVVSGLLHESLLELYDGWWALGMERSSTISGKAEGRRRITEVLVLSYKPQLDRMADSLKVVRVGVERLSR